MSSPSETPQEHFMPHTFSYKHKQNCKILIPETVAVLKQAAASLISLFAQLLEISSRFSEDLLSNWPAHLIGMVASPA